MRSLRLILALAFLVPVQLAKSQPDCLRSSTADARATWSKVLAVETVFALAPDPRGGTVYAACDSGMFKTTDAGATCWQVFNDGLTNLFVLALAVDPVDTGTLCMGARDGGVFRYR
jgi:hypothetical protein